MTVKAKFINIYHFFIEFYFNKKRNNKKIKELPDVGKVTKYL